MCRWTRGKLSSQTHFRSSKQTLYKVYRHQCICLLSKSRESRLQTLRYKSRETVIQTSPRFVICIWNGLKPPVITSRSAVSSLCLGCENRAARAAVFVWWVTAAVRRKSWMLMSSSDDWFLGISQKNVNAKTNTNQREWVHVSYDVNWPNLQIQHHMKQSFYQLLCSLLIDDFELKRETDQDSASMKFRST